MQTSNFCGPGYNCVILDNLKQRFFPSLNSVVLFSCLENNPSNNGYLCLGVFTVADVNSNQCGLIAFSLSAEDLCSLRYQKAN